jgi:tRNA-Thr(GGU) m(6)t(6)A37 methyltransferase TsaA
MLYSK